MTVDQTRDAITAALAALILRALPDAAQSGFEGKPAKPARIGDGGAIQLTSLGAGEPEVDLNPLTYHHDCDFSLQISAATREQADQMLKALGDGIAADRTLSGTCEWADARAPLFDEETMAGADGHIVAQCSVTASYVTTNPLG